MAIQTAPPDDAAAGAAGDDSPRRRLEQREKRIKFALAELARLAQARSPGGPVPAALAQAHAEFAAELADIRRRLGDL